MAKEEKDIMPESATEVSSTIEKYKDKPLVITQMLLEIQAATGNFVPENVAVAVSRATGIPVSDISDLIDFYSMLSDTRRGKHVIRMCNSAPCHVCGSADVANTFLEELGLAHDGMTTSDGMFTFEFFQCLGVCDVAPAAIVDEVVHGNLDKVTVKKLIADLRKEGED